MASLFENGSVRCGTEALKKLLTDNLDSFLIAEGLRNNT